MRAGRVALLAMCLVAASACYHQVIHTGRAPGPTVVSRPWTPTFLWGLVAPAPIDVSQQCRSGVATVETQMSVPNWFASLITIGIYSPRDVKVTCAAGSSLKPGLREFYVAASASAEERDRVVRSAINESERLHKPVIIRF